MKWGERDKDAILDYFFSKSQVPICILEGSYDIIEANDAFKTLVKNEIGQKFCRLTDLFVVKEYREYGMRRINLLRPLDDKTVHLRGSCIETSRGTMVVFEDYVMTNNQVTESLSEMNIEMANKTRELAKKNMRLQEANDKITELVNTDYLTKVKNRKYFYERLEESISLAYRENASFSVILADIDHFKRVNDTYGHGMGDKVLVRFTETLQKNLRSQDILARFGGEEFIVLLPFQEGENAVIVAEKLRQAVEDVLFEEAGLSITASFGVAVYRKGEHREELLKRADEGMYQAKKSGRNKVVFLKSE